MNNNILYVPKNIHVTIADLSQYGRLKLAPKSGVYSRIDDIYIFNKDVYDTIDMGVNPFIFGRASVIVTPPSASCNSSDISDFLSSDDVGLTGNNSDENSDATHS
nr:hypothetical protein [Rickettsia sp. TH2014]